MYTWRIDQNQDTVELRILDGEKLIVEIANIEPQQASELASQLKKMLQKEQVIYLLRTLRRCTHDNYIPTRPL